MQNTNTSGLTKVNNKMETDCEYEAIEGVVNAMRRRGFTHEDTTHVGRLLRLTFSTGTRDVVVNADITIVVTAEVR